jgi:predicted NBD/HSP70 family sugar kinase
MSKPSTVGAAPGHARNFNRRLVLETIRLQGPISRATIARKTGLSVQTLSNIADELLDGGLLRKQDVRTGGRGAPAVGLTLDPDGGFTFGISLDHRRLVLVLVDITGSVRGQETMDIEGLAPRMVLRQVKRLATDLARQVGAAAERLWGAGVVMPMQFENGTPVAFGPTSMPAWQQVPIVDLLSASLGIPVLVENDATAAAVGEQLHGAGRRLRDFFYIYIGVGVGGGMILSGHPYRGSAGRAGELGHIVVEPGGRRCACGNRGCLERYASLAAAQHALDGRPEGSSRVDPARIASRIDELGSWIDVAAQHLATACITIDNLLDPQAIVIGGIVPEVVLTRLIDGLQEHLGRIRLTNRHIQIVKPEVDRETPALGGAALPLFSGLAPTVFLRGEPALPSQAAPRVKSPRSPVR